MSWLSDISNSFSSMFGFGGGNKPQFLPQTNDLGGTINRMTNTITGAQAPLGNILGNSGSGGGGWSNFLFGGQGQAGALSGIAGALSGIGQSWMANKQFGLAKDEFNFQKQFALSNLNNSMKAYNTQLEERLRGRTPDYEGKEADIQRQLEEKKLK